MEDKEFTKDMYNLYVAQRKKLDDLVPKSVLEKYIKKEEQYEQFKEKQKQRYRKRVEEEGEAFRQKMRDKNNATYRRRKEREENERKKAIVSESDIPESVSRYSSSMTKSNYSVDDDEEDLESVFSEAPNINEIIEPVAEQAIQKLIHHRFIGF